jgi:hypothetical protein
MTRVFQISISAITADEPAAKSKQEAINDLLDNLRERLSKIIPDDNYLSFVVGHKELSAEEMCALVMGGIVP